MALNPEGLGSPLVNEGLSAPLLFAAQHGHRTTIRSYIGQGANIDSKDSEGNTPLMWAAKEGWKMTCILLLELGANIEAKNKEDKTAEQLADEKGFTEIARILKSIQNLKTSQISDLTPIEYIMPKPKG